MRKRRDVETSSLSFLDSVACGFGAIILLLILTKVFEPVLVQEELAALNASIEQLEDRTIEIEGETQNVRAELRSRQEQLSDLRERVARLQGDLSAIEGEFAASKTEASVTNIIEGRLAVARQELTDEMQRLLGADYRRSADDDVIGGIPVDSEYIIFIIDTSGSMYQFAWPLMMQKMQEILAIYPDVRGIQIMNDMGNYMFSQYRGRWIPDTPGRRKAILERLRNWNPFSNSSPVEGITSAINTFYAPDKRISLYVMGDEFTGGSIQRVLDTVEKINRPDDSGERRVRIHAIGFPVQFARGSRLQLTGIRFATLMRAMCADNGGTFVGLDDYQL